MSTKLNLKALAQSRQKKIESPLAKYNGAGQLYCVLCNSQVKNEIYWTGHVNGKTHKENLANLKKVPQKRPADEFKTPLPAKVQKVEDVVKKAELELMELIEEGGDDDKKEVDEEEKPVVRSIPEGFFDDPKEDAKARGQKFRDPQDVEWDKFVKEIASEDVKSNEIVSEEQDKTAVERELDHIEEQMAQWQRVIDLEKKAEEFAQRKKSVLAAYNTSSTPDNDSMDAESDEEEEYNEELDWRNKKR